MERANDRVARNARNTRNARTKRDAATNRSATLRAGGSSLYARRSRQECTNIYITSSDDRCFTAFRATYVSSVARNLARSSDWSNFKAYGLPTWIFGSGIRFVEALTHVNRVARQTARQTARRAVSGRTGIERTEERSLNRETFAYSQFLYFLRFEKPLTLFSAMS